eukprot:181228_1
MSHPSVSDLDKITQTNQGLARYYAHMGVKDYNNKFLEWCEENDYDDDLIADEFTQDPGDSAIIDFDDKFPLPMHDDQKQEEITRKTYAIIKRCWTEVDAYLEDENTVTSLTKFCDPRNFVISHQNQLHFQKIYREQCPAIYHSGAKEDKAFLTALIAGATHRVEYVQHLFDLYMRASIKEFKQTQKVLEVETWAKQYSYFNGLNQDIRETATGATKSFGARVCPHLLLNPITKIQDSLENTTKYICEAVQFVKKLAEKKQKTCPFQVDVCIVFPKTKCVQTTVDVKSNEQEELYDANDDDDDLYDEKGDEKRDAFYDRIGDIALKLKSNGLKYSTMNCGDLGINPKRVMGNAFEEFSKQFNLCEDYPSKKRFVILVDRRQQEEEHDDITIYEPPKGVRDIPNNAVSEWYLNASKTCILPNVGYDPKKVEEEDETTNIQKKEEGSNFNINALSCCDGALLTLSFHVKQSDSIKCYLYLNGQICRFFADDILDVLPLFFDKEFDGNSKFCEDEVIQQQIDDEVRKDLIDNQFGSFKRMWEAKDC